MSGNTAFNEVICLSRFQVTVRFFKKCSFADYEYIWMGHKNLRNTLWLDTKKSKFMMNKVKKNEQIFQGIEK